MLANPCAVELVDVELDEVVVVVRLTVPVVNAPASVVRGCLTKLLTGNLELACARRRLEVVTAGADEV